MSASAESMAELPNNPENVASEAGSQVHKLNVLSGCQQGAVSTLRPQVPCSIGRAISNDIVLRDDSVEAEHITVTVEQNEVIVHCLHGTVDVNGIAVNPGESSSFSQSGLMQLGEVALLVENEAHGMSQHLSSLANGMHNDSASDAQVESLHHADARANQSKTPENVGATGSKNVTTAFVTIAAMLIGATIVWKSGLFEPTVEEPMVLSVLLESTPFSELVIEQQGQLATVNGFLDTRSEYAELNQWLASSGLQVNNSVVVGEVLADKVLDVFRVHGVGAEVAVANEGVVTVVTSEADTNLLDTINERLMLDVPGIESLAIENTPPPVAKEDAPLDAGKRVAMVVSDSPAYIVTEDSSRYFVGSWLPTGHRIQSIIDGKVTLEKEGVETMLEF